MNNNDALPRNKGFNRGGRSENSRITPKNPKPLPPMHGSASDSPDVFHRIEFKLIPVLAVASRPSSLTAFD